MLNFLYGVAITMAIILGLIAAIFAAVTVIFFMYKYLSLWLEYLLKRFGDF